ncbi:hypothetical protein [Legionella shakespearei]|uniref:Uncharacterized protein n=1 Tax=Legionella shakespearei DSM 23087 TaxID=1122169 RepID=A0A0W0YW54_9GAMM|nr:hypothetical protein [Legionella shakespearei]KTD60927.1 hypothetical protein Lsha_1338 [Legionella shakespearei DSM 23087]
MKRGEFVETCSIREKELQKLVNQIMSRPDTRENRILLQHALKGDYSDFGSSHPLPNHLLFAELEAANAVEPESDWGAVLRNAHNGEYEHGYGASCLFFHTRRFVNEATQQADTRKKQEAAEVESEFGLLRK